MAYLTNSYITYTCRSVTLRRCCTGVRVSSITGSQITILVCCFLSAPSTSTASMTKAYSPRDLSMSSDYCTLLFIPNLFLTSFKMFVSAVIFLVMIRTELYSQTAVSVVFALSLILYPGDVGVPV